MCAHVDERGHIYTYFYTKCTVLLPGDAIQYTHMSGEGLQVAIFFTFFLGCGVGFYLAKIML